MNNYPVPDSVSITLVRRREESFMVPEYGTYRHTTEEVTHLSIPKSALFAVVGAVVLCVGLAMIHNRRFGLNSEKI